MVERVVEDIAGDGEKVRGTWRRKKVRHVAVGKFDAEKAVFGRGSCVLLPGFQASKA